MIGVTPLVLQSHTRRDRAGVRPPGESPGAGRLELDRGDPAQAALDRHIFSARYRLKMSSFAAVVCGCGVDRRDVGRVVSRMMGVGADRQGCHRGR
jgi:hypothetical protein